MPSQTVRYWKKVGPDTREPHSCSVEERNLVMHYRGDEAWCPECKAVVEPVEMFFRVGFVSRACPWCETRLT